jgi:hypothetical protein
VAGALGWRGRNRGDAGSEHNYSVTFRASHLLGNCSITEPTPSPHEGLGTEEGHDLT